MFVIFLCTLRYCENILVVFLVLAQCSVLYGTNITRFNTLFSQSEQVF